MEETKIEPMKAPVHTLPRREARTVRGDQRMSRAIQARRREGFRLDEECFPSPPSPRGGGRAWINGREVGGLDTRYAHLSASYD